MNNKQVSLLVCTDIHLHNGSRFEEVLKLVKDDKEALQPDVLLIGGDSAGGGKPPRMGGSLSDWVPVYDPEMFSRAAKSIFGEGLSVYITYGSHDKNARGGYRSFFSGPADCKDFYIYGISFAQMRFACRGQVEETGYDGPDLADPFGCCANESAQAFIKWEKGLEDKKPVFVMSHLPLHAHRHDNLGAKMWCDVLNQAAERRPVYVFFGHNHSAERRSDLDKDYYMTRPGRIVPVQCSEREEKQKLPIKFTYLNAGYIINGCATLLTLEDTDSPSYENISVKRYEAG